MTRNSPDANGTRPDGATAGFRNVVRIYQAASGEVHALRGVDVDFPRGSVTAIAGPSGGGKSTLLSILALRDRASAGAVTLFGNDVTRARGAALKALRRTGIAWVPQRPSHGLLPHLSARDNLVQIARIRGRREGWTPDEALELLGLTPRAAGRPGQLSGGEQQRLAVAAALMHAPPLVVADEPTAELDDPNADRVIEAFMAVAEQGTTCVLSTHDSRALRHLPRVLHLRQGVLSAERSGTGQRASGQVRTAEAVIDSAGRLQLPPEALLLFPGRRAAVRIEGGAVILDPPGAPSSLAEPAASGSPTVLAGPAVIPPNGLTEPALTEPALAVPDGLTEPASAAPDPATEPGPDPSNRPSAPTAADLPEASA